MNLNYSKIFKFIFILLWLFLFITIAKNDNFKENLLSLHLENPFLAPIIFICIQVTLSSLILPCSPITLIAGIIWGLKLGLLISLISTIISSICTFMLGKYFLSNLMGQRDYLGIWNKIQMLIFKYNWKSSFVAHLNPIFPGSSLGYLFGASQISFIPFIVGATLGAIPLQIIGVLIGDKLF